MLLNNVLIFLHLFIQSSNATSVYFTLSGGFKILINLYSCTLRRETKKHNKLFLNGAFFSKKILVEKFVLENNFLSNHTMRPRLHFFQIEILYYFRSTFEKYDNISCVFLQNGFNLAKHFLGTFKKQKNHF